VAEAVAAEVEGLKRKNAELIDANKKLRKGQEIDPAELERIEAERDEWKGKAQAAEKAVKKAEGERDAAIKARTDTDTAFNNTLRDAQLTEALAKVGVTNPVHLKYAKAELASQASVVEENGTRVVKVGEKMLDAFVTEWAGTEEGKTFIDPSGTTGFSAHGAGRPSGAQPKRSEMNHANKANYIREHGQEAYESLPE